MGTSADRGHLVELAQCLDVHGRSTMTKAELVDALQKASAQKTGTARDQS